MPLSEMSANRFKTGQEFEQKELGRERTLISKREAVITSPSAQAVVRGSIQRRKIGREASKEDKYKNGRRGERGSHAGEN